MTFISLTASTIPGTEPDVVDATYAEWTKSWTPSTTQLEIFHCRIEENQSPRPRWHRKEKKKEEPPTTANAYYNENYNNFLSFLTKHKDVNYKMRRARGYVP